MFLQNAGIYLQAHTALQPRRPTLIFIYNLFNDTVNNSNYIVLNDRMISE
jgi:hypothetical protein